MTYISWFSDIGLYLEDYLMYNVVTLAWGIGEPLLTCSSFTNFSIAVDDTMAAKHFSFQNKSSSSEQDSFTPCNMHLTPRNMQKILHGYFSAK